METVASTLGDEESSYIHGRKLAEQATIQRRTAISELREIYVLREEMLPGDRCILMDMFDQHAEKPTLSTQPQELDTHFQTDSASQR